MTQIVTKFIADNAINGNKIRLNNAEMLRGRNQANNADINILSINTSNNIEFQNLPYASAALGIPTAPKQFATIEYIQNYLAGKGQAKNAVQYLMTNNVAGTFNTGSTTINANIVGGFQLVIDGKSFTGADVNNTTPMRVALVGQTFAYQNGIYDLTAASAGSFTLTRSFDFTSTNNAAGTSVQTGDYFVVVFGTAYAGYEIILTTQNPIVLDSTSLTFAMYPTAITLTAGDMINKVNNVLSVNLATLSGLVSTNPGVAGGQLMIKTDTAALVKDQTTKLDSSTNAIITKKPRKSTYTLNSTDVSNQYVDLPYIASQDSVNFLIAGAGSQLETTDYAVNYTGGTGGATRITFQNGLATGGISALASADVVQVLYTSF